MATEHTWISTTGDWGSIASWSSGQVPGAGGIGSVYFNHNAGDIGDVVLDSLNVASALFLDGVIRHLYIKRGFCRVVAGLQWVASNFIVVHNGHLVVDASAFGNWSTFIQTGGYVECLRDSLGGTAILSGGFTKMTGRLLDGQSLHVQPGGILQYAPTAALGSAHNPFIVCHGLLDLSKSLQQLQPSSLIIGETGAVIGSLIDPVVTPLAAHIDLREEYP